MKLKNFKISKNWIISLLIWGFLILIWVISSSQKLINTAFLPTPELIFNSVLKPVFWQTFGLDLLATMSRFGLGMTIGVLLSFGFILLGFYFLGWYTFTTQLNKILKYLPPPVVIPMNILFFGVNNLTIIFTAAFSSFILYLNFSLSIIEKEEKNFRRIQTNWKIKPWDRFGLFFVPISSFLNYRVMPAMIIWTFGIILIIEIILGGKFGLGIRLLQYQQLYQTGNLFLLVALILFSAFILETFFLDFFARLKWDLRKKTASILLILLLITSISYQIYAMVSTTSSDSKTTIISYKAAINLPLFVYVEKFNDLDLSLKTASSGTQAIDSLLSGQAAISGFGDIPNVIAAFDQNRDLQVVSQVVEKPNQPSLFLVSREEITTDNYSKLNNSRVGYYPNNAVIAQGLSFVFSLNKANSETIEYIGTNDPNTLVQALAADQMQAFLSLEPFIADSEDNFGLARLNPKNTAIKGITFENLPLAATVINKSKLTVEDQKTFVTGLKKSIQFIRDNSNTDFKATGELLEIMKKYDINTNSSLSAFQSTDEINPKDLEILVNLLQIFGVTKANANFDYNSFYRLQD